MRRCAEISNVQPKPRKPRQDDKGTFVLPKDGTGEYLNRQNTQGKVLSQSFVARSRFSHAIPFLRFLLLLLLLAPVDRPCFSQ